MSLFHLSTECLKAEVIRLLTELAERQHAGDADRIEVRFLSGQFVMGGTSFAPRPDKLVVDQAGYERAALAYWLAVVPDLEEVLVVVRSYGRPVRTILLEPAATPAHLGVASARGPSE